MDTRIKEKDISTVNPMRFTRFLVAEGGKNQTGVEVYSMAVLPKFYGPNAPAEIYREERLIIEIDGEVDEGVVKRMGDVVAQLIAKQAAFDSNGGTSTAV